MSEANPKKLNVEFWAGQIFTLVATVIGVYLAANSGFQKALEFESLQHQRDAYYVQSALYSELNSNLNAARQWTDTFNKDPQHNDMYLDKDKYQFSFFLWETMQEGSAVFEVPYERLGQVASFYDQASHLREVMFSGNPFEAPKAANKLAALEQQVREGFMNTFEQQLKAIKQDLVDQGVNI